MTIWIVLKNGKVDTVFNTFASAFDHSKKLGKTWNITEIIKKEIQN